MFRHVSTFLAQLPSFPKPSQALEDVTKLPEELCQAAESAAWAAASAAAVAPKVAMRVLEAVAMVKPYAVPWVSSNLVIDMGRYGQIMTDRLEI